MQSQVIFWGLYVIAIYLVATHIGVAFAVIAFGGGILMTLAATAVGRRRARRNRERGADGR